MVSIIVRTHNEEKWITACLKGIFSQDHTDIEVIVVDNKSTDKTVEKARTFDVKVVRIEEYLPGAAINLGIRHSRGDLIAIISAHCIPKNRTWLSQLVQNLKDPQVAGVYGRQEPLSFTSDQDKRDLLNLFGLDRRVQIKDSFFHNANSLIRRAVWEQYPFDETTTNIEDRIWAQAVLDARYKLVYEPDASVYHWHGVHQNGNQERCKNVVRILETLQVGQNGHSEFLESDNLTTLAIIPSRGEPQYLGGRPLIAYTIDRAQESEFIQRIVVSTDNARTAEIARDLGAEVPFMRPEALSHNYVDVTAVYQYTLAQLEDRNDYTDLMVLLQETYPFRPHGFIDRLVRQLLQNGLDSVLAVQAEYKSCWERDNGHLKRVGKGFMPRQFKDPLYIGLSGLATVSHPAFLRQGDRFGKKIGVLETTDPASSLEVRNTRALKLANKFINKWWSENQAPALPIAS